MAKRLTVIVEKGKGERNFSCFATENIEKCGLLGYGSTAREAMDDIKVSAQECKEIVEERGGEWPELEYSFIFDIGAFFDYYPLNISAFAKYIGMNPAQLRQYASAAKEPRQATIDKIREGMKTFLNDIGSLPMIDRPTIAYV